MKSFFAKEYILCVFLPTFLGVASVIFNYRAIISALDGLISSIIQSVTNPQMDTELPNIILIILLWGFLFISLFLIQKKFNNKKINEILGRRDIRLFGLLLIVFSYSFIGFFELLLTIELLLRLA